MKTIAVAAQKGGSGKTTISVHLAASAIDAGLRVGLIDADPQGSASAWANSRQSEGLAVIALPPHQVQQGIDAARADNYDLLIIDTPPHAAAGTTAALARADLILIPVRPSMLDLAAVPATLAMLEASGKPAAFVVSAAPIRAGETRETERVLEQTGIAVLQTTIHDRTSYRRALAHGKAVSEYEPKGKAAFEIRSLWREVKSLLEKEQ